ncbi:MAG: tyrosine-type recombinase/integrase [Pseudomonadota bacterium]
MMAFDTVHRFEVHDDLVGRANHLIEEMQRLAKAPEDLTVEDIIERRMIETLGVALIAEARARNHNLVTDPEPFHDAWDKFVSATCEGEAELNVLERRSYERGRTDQSEAYARGWAKPTLVAPTEPPVSDDKAVTALDASTATSTAGSDLRLSALVDMHLNDIRTADGNDVNVAEAQLPLTFMVDLLGDPYLAQLGSQEFGQVERALPNVPTLAHIPSKHRRSMFARMKYAEKHGWDELKRASEKTLTNRWHRRLHNFLDWAIDKQHLEGPRYKFTLVGAENPVGQGRDAWTIEEVRQFFSLPLFTGAKSRHRLWKPGGLVLQGAPYWAYLFVVFLGMRPSEISRLKVEALFEREGIHYIDMRPEHPVGLRRRRRGQAKRKNKKSKTDAGERIVPLPGFILDLGFLDHVNAVQAAGGERMFPDWKDYTSPAGRDMPSHYLTKEFGQIREREGMSTDMKLYGGRHTRATWMDEAGIAQRTRLRALGHEEGETADTYGAVDLTDAEARMVLGSGLITSS